MRRIPLRIHKELRFTALALVLCFSLGASSSMAAKSADDFAARQAIQEESKTDHGGGSHLGEQLPLWSCIPFAGVLLSIAIIPMIAPVFWHHHFPKVALAWGLVFAIPFFMFYGSTALYELFHVLLGEYMPFIILLWGLFTVSGGIYVDSSMEGRPGVNVALLVIGTLLASWMGTTGAAMLLIRPLLRANKERRYKVHTVIFFIFLVANVGGVLTPLGDPPLFLGFLNGVPFFWTFKLWNKLLFAMAYLLAVYYIIESFLYRKELKSGLTPRKSQLTLKVHGGSNFIYLGGIVLAVLLSGSLHIGEFSIAGIGFTYQSVFRDAVILMMGLLSLATTQKSYREANGFSWFPIKEVAFLFLGIFITIVAPLQILRAGTAGAAHSLIEMVNSPASYFWISGTLSSFLDNAPTYLTFFNMSLGEMGIAPSQVHAILSGTLAHPMSAQFIRDLTAISAASVFFGANTYIGNAPNFMVRSITEENRVSMPSFFGYMLWSCAILLPLFVAMTFIYYK